MTVIRNEVELLVHNARNRNANRNTPAIGEAAVRANSVALDRWNRWSEANPEAAEAFNATFGKPLDCVMVYAMCERYLRRYESPEVARVQWEAACGTFTAAGAEILAERRVGSA
jgi:hypothetical protein